MTSFEGMIFHLDSISYLGPRCETLGKMNEVIKNYLVEKVTFG